MKIIPVLCIKGASGATGPFLVRLERTKEMEVELRPISEEEVSSFGDGRRYCGSLQIGNVMATVTSNRLSPTAGNRMTLFLRYAGPNELNKILDQIEVGLWKKFEPYGRG